MYSKEEGTPAEKMPEQIHGNTKKSRYNKIMAKQQKISNKNLQNKIGKTTEVLVEDMSFDVNSWEINVGAIEVMKETILFWSFVYEEVSTEGDCCFRRRDCCSLLSFNDAIRFFADDRLDSSWLIFAMYEESDCGIDDTFVPVNSICLSWLSI